MRQWLVAIFLLIFAPVLAHADDDCILKGSDLERRLPTKTKTSTAYTGPVKFKRSKHEVSEKVRLKAGGMFTLTQGGCSHIGITYEISGWSDATPVTDRKRYLERAASFLGTLPDREGKPLDTQFADSVGEAIKNIPRANVADKEGTVLLNGDCSPTSCVSAYACGDAQCSVTVTQKPNGKVTLSMLYDFPL